MTTLACSWARRGAQRPADAIVPMLEAGQRPTSATVHVRGAVILGVAERGSRAPEAALALDTAAGLSIALDGRLHERPALEAELALSRSEPRPTDAQLVLAAYMRWGEDAWRHLHGDWALVLHDPRSRALLLARDPMGSRLLYVHRSKDLVVAGSTIDAVLAHASVPRRLDRERAPALLSASAEWDGSLATCFEGVSKVPAGGMVRCTPDDEQRRSFWRPEPREHGASDAPGAVWQALAAAAGDRAPAGSDVGLLLSGGIDSQAVLAALRGAASTRGRARITTLSGVGTDPRRCPEALHVELALRQVVDASLVQPPSAAAWRRGFERVVERAEDPFVLPVSALRATLLASDEARNLDVVLTGMGAETILGDGSNAVARLARERGVRAALGASCRFAAAWRQERLSLLWNGGVRPFLPAGLRRAWRVMRPRPPASAVSSLLRPEAARDLMRAGRPAADEATMPRDATGRWLDSQEIVARQLASGVLSAAAERYARLGRCFNLEISHPYLDHRVVELGLSLPLAERLQDGRSKGVLHVAAEPHLARRTARRSWAPNADHLTPRLRDLAGWVCELLGGDLGPVGDILDGDRVRELAAACLRRPDEASVRRVLPAASLVAVTRPRLAARGEPSVTSGLPSWVQVVAHEDDGRGSITSDPPSPA